MALELFGSGAGSAGAILTDLVPGSTEVTLTRAVFLALFGYSSGSGSGAKNLFSSSGAENFS